MTYPQLNKESIVYNSIKKFFVDHLVDGNGVFVVFDGSMSPPEDDTVNRWVFVDVQDTSFGHLNRKLVYLYCFSKNDLESDNLALLMDVVLGSLYDGHLPLYDSDLSTKIGGATITIESPSRLYKTKDKTKMRYIPITLTWGGVW